MIVNIMVGTCYLEEFQLVHKGIYISLQTERLIPRKLLTLKIYERPKAQNTFKIKKKKKKRKK